MILRYEEAAEAALRKLDEWGPADEARMQVIALAQVYATLALMDETRCQGRHRERRAVRVPRMIEGA